MYIKSHTHKFEGKTTFDDGHIHKYRQNTIKAIPRRGGHIHSYEGATTFNDRHNRNCRDYTSGHIHLLKEITSSNNEHVHLYGIERLKEVYKS